MRIIDFLYYFFWNTIFELQANIRFRVRIAGPFSELMQYKDRYRGKRCFICATGPSLRIADLEMLKGEYCFGVNSICEAYPMTEWRASFYVFQDYKIMEHYGEEIDDKQTKVFVGRPLVDDKRVKKPKASWIVFPLNCYYQMHWLKYHQKARIKFSTDCYKEVYGGFTVTYSAIQLAFYMGFKEIFLLGVDCNYKPGTQNHFKRMRNEFRRTVYMSNGERELQIKAYRIARMEAKRLGRKIINVSRGGELNVFPRKELEEIIT